MLEAHKEIDGASRGDKLVDHEIDGGTADVPGHPRAIGQHDRNLEPNPLLTTLFLVHDHGPFLV